MICPRCTVAEISADTHTCVLCGYSPGGVTLEVGAREELDEAAHRELADQFEIDATLAEEPGPVLVYAARETGADRVVALRVAPRSGRDTRVEERFQRDMTAAAALDHPHIVPLYRFGTTKTLFWHATKHVEGRTLAQVLLEKRRIDAPACLRLVEQIASALQYAHRRGAVHGDFQPAHVLLDDDWALVTGFAAVRSPAEGGERADARAGAYVAPETATVRQPGPASDQYALAATIHECLTGAPPTAEQRGAASHPDIPANLWTALRRALEPDPAKRFPSVSEFVSALSAIEVQPVPASPAPGLPPDLLRSTQRVLLVDPYRSSRLRQRLLIGAAVVAGLFLLIKLMQPAASPPAMPSVVIPAPAATQAPATTAPPSTDPGQPSRTPVRASAGAPSGPTAAPVAAEMGLLFINASPWGEVFVNDELLGTTPLAALPVAPGEHTIRVVREGYQPFERTVSVAPGQQIRLTNIVLEAAQP